MNIKSLHAFLNVVDGGSLSVAAAKMRLSQPAVSRLIRLLETELDVLFFYRDQRKLTPTRQAELFYPEARRVVSAIHEFPDIIAQIKSSSLTPLRISCQLRAANGVVIPAVAKFSQQYPEVRLVLDIHPRRELFRRFQEEKFDVGVYMMPSQISGVNMLEKYQMSVQVLLPKDHRLAKNKSIVAADLVNDRLISLRRGLLMRDVVENVFRKAGLTLDIFHEVSSNDIAQKLVHLGLGYCFTDSTALDDHQRRSLVLIPFQPKTLVEIGICGPQNHNTHAYRDTFVECLKDVCSSLGFPPELPT